MAAELPVAAWAGITAAIAGAIGWVTNHRTDKADAASSLTSSAVAIVNELQEEIQLMRERLALVEAEVSECEQRYRDLLRQIETEGD